MTEEIKTCDCKEKCIKKLKEFLFLSSAVFVGAFLAILLSAQILRPKCPMMQHRMILPPPPIGYYHQQVPPRGHFDGQFRHHRGPHKMKYRENMGGRVPNFQPPIKTPQQKPINK